MTGSPLDGLRILDLTSVVVGPVCTLRLAQQGAEVIKIESRDGDLMRALGGVSPTGEHSGTYLHLNRGKRAICLDLKSDGLEVVRRLVDHCDVFVSNIRPAALNRIGLDAETLMTRKETLIHCLISGFGPGPYRGMPAYDSVLQGASGIAGLSERRGGVPEYSPLLLCDHIVGEIAAGAILAALVQRGRTGKGSAIEIPMMETMAAFVLQEHLAQQSFVPQIGTAGDVRTLNPGSRPIQTADGWISLTCNTDAQVRAFLTAIGKPELIDDPRFASVAARVRNSTEWFQIRTNALHSKSTADWLKDFAKADVPAMRCNSLESLVDDPHIRAVGLLERDMHPTEGEVVGIRSTILRDGYWDNMGSPASPKGWDTVAVLKGFGFATNEIEKLIASGAIYDAHEQEG